MTLSDESLGLRVLTVGEWQERPGFEAFLARPRLADLCGDVNWETSLGG
jgi:hypothetical protein